MPHPDPVVKAAPATAFVGSPGVPMYAGWLADEQEPRLLGYKRLLAFRAMAESHPVISVALQMVATACASVEWHVPPAAPNDPTADRAADIVQRSMDELRYGLTAPTVRGGGWSAYIEEQSSAVRDGFNLHEATYRRDGRDWLWDRFEVRRASTIQQWESTGLDGGGDWLGVQQQTPSHRVFIPSERLIHVIARRNGGNPEGISLLRPLWKPWRMQADLFRLHGIGTERNLSGMPVMEVPAEVYSATSGDQYLHKEAIKAFLRSVRNDEQMGGLLPCELDSSGMPTGYKFRLMASEGGGKASDILQMVQFYESQIAIGLLVQFLQLGAGGSGGSTGSFSLASSHTSTHAAFLGAFLDRITAANQVEINRLTDLNGIPVAARPVLHHGDIEKIDLGELGTYLDVLSKVGVPMVDPAAVAHLRELGGLPPLDPADEASEDYPATAPGGAPVAPGDAPVASTGLNGAQVSAVLDVAARVASGSLTIAGAQALMRIAFPEADPADVLAVLEGAIDVPKPEPVVPVAPIAPPKKAPKAPKLPSGEIPGADE